MPESLEDAFREVFPQNGNGAPKQEPQSLEDAYKEVIGPKPQAEQEPASLDHDFNWGKMAGNILPDIIQNVQDLKHLADPKTYKALGLLVAESVAAAKEPRQRRQRRSLENRSTRRLFSRTNDPNLSDKRSLKGNYQTPVLDAVGKFYQDNYDLTTSEGQQRWQKYVEEHPAQFASDVVAIAAALVAPAAAGSAIVKGSKIGRLGKAQVEILKKTLKADSDHLIAKGAIGTYRKIKGTPKAIGQSKIARAVARIGEGAIDPGAAIGRSGSDIASYAFSKRRQPFTDGTGYLRSTDKTGKRFEPNINPSDQILLDAWQDGFTPDALKKHINKDGVVIDDNLRQQFFGNTADDLIDLGERLSKYTTRASWKKAAAIGAKRLAEFGVGKGAGLASILAGFGSWQHLVAGMITDSAFKKIFANIDTIPEWVYREPPGWQATAKTWGLITGRAGQRGSRIKEYAERQNRQESIQRMRNRDLRQ